MKILHIGKYYPPHPGGIEYFLTDLMYSQTQNGDTVAAIIHDDSKSSHLLRKEGWAKECAYSASLIFSVPVWGKLIYAPISPTFPFTLKKVLRSFEPDIIHIHMPNASAFWLLVSRTAQHTSWVIHWHSDIIPLTNDKLLRLAYRIYKPFETFLLKKSQGIIATSDSYLNNSAPLRPFRHKCHVVPLGINLENSKQPGRDLKQWAETIWDNRKIKIIAIGRLVYYKGHDVLLKAIQTLDNLKLVIVGDGNHKTHVAQTIKKLNLDDRVVLTGYLSKNKLFALLSTCDLLCLSSIERTEAFGLVLLEAMLFAKPVIASDISGSGVGWVVKQNKTGILVQPNNPDKLSEAIIALGGDKERKRALGQSAFKRVESLYNIGPISRKIRHIYSRLAKKGN